MNMKNKTFAIISIGCLLLSACADPSYPRRLSEPPPSASYRSEAAALAGSIREPLQKARYMEARPLGPAKVAGWESYPLQKYGYTLVDRNGTRRDAEAIMLNPSAEQLAEWIVSASYSLKGRYDEAFCKKLFDHVIGCSGGQFVVRGICLEDMDGNGIHKAYPFQDGVTVRIKQIGGFPERPLTTQETAAALGSTPADVTQFYKSARLQSSTPSHWASFTHTGEVSGAEWPKTVRTEYQKAWNSRENKMLTATAKALGY
jgi:hypothetical protein